MLVPVVCFGCGRPIGDVADVFLTMREARVREELAKRGITAAQVGSDVGLTIICEDLLDLVLGDSSPASSTCVGAGPGARDCCRAHLSQAMVFPGDYY